MALIFVLGFDFKFPNLRIFKPMKKTHSNLFALIKKHPAVEKMFRGIFLLSSFEKVFFLKKKGFCSRILALYA